MTASIKRICVFCGLGALAVVVLMTGWDILWDEPGQQTASQSERMAESRGTWLQSLQPSPSEFELDGQTFHINSAWLEAQSHQSERLWGSSETRLYGYSLCFTLTEHRVPHTHYFTTGDDSDPVSEISWSMETVVYTVDLESVADVSALQLALTTTHTDDPIPRHFTFTTKQ